MHHADQSNGREIVIRTSRLRKSFLKHEVLQGIDLEIPRGLTVGLLGSNGAGKSTLIKCLLGLLKPSSGTVELAGESSWDLTVDVKERLGYVPQISSLLPWMTVASLVDYVGAFYQYWQPERAHGLVRDWNLDPKQIVGKLSVGQKQKLSTILALGHSPELLILDEPVASLDPAARRQFMQELIALTADERHTVLFSTHIMSDVERVASHVAIMSGGRISYFGELDSLKERIKRVRLSRPERFPDGLQCPEAIQARFDGQHAVLSIDTAQVDLDMLAERFGVAVSVEDLNLEEIFLELEGRWLPASASSRAGLEGASR
ncbi:MAG: ABC transporter ATP-binding protein [Pirellulaceae bacterium]|nr:ABC transporter ATP-binding protein [Pirellulaceae bacterium]